ncbi:hypothetical protein BaRGS_00018545 [Batillaria attramentaria]|uniref:Uncharacterized protein n=1 Tax=Batillaria attramentaria TaxID=370345 RepID=A0ABD0KSD3_9CAEN
MLRWFSTAFLGECFVLRKRVGGDTEPGEGWRRGEESEGGSREAKPGHGNKPASHWSLGRCRNKRTLATGSVENRACEG